MLTFRQLAAAISVSPRLPTSYFEQAVHRFQKLGKILIVDLFTLFPFQRHKKDNLK